MIIIIGAGVSGLSTSFHVGHENAIILESSDKLGGHAASQNRNGFVWDNGPHLSFTKIPYVRDLLSKSINNEFFTKEMSFGNFYGNNWVGHPVFEHLEDLNDHERIICEKSFANRPNQQIENYEDWLRCSFGEEISKKFYGVYTEKYWTVKPNQMSTDWIGERIKKPKPTESALANRKGNNGQHYIEKIRYPKFDGFWSFFNILSKGANVHYNKNVTSIDLNKRTVATENGDFFEFTNLVNTIPLPEFIKLCKDVPSKVRSAAESLLCTSVILTQIEAKYVNKIPFDIIYVYDERKLSTRVHFPGNLSKNNVPRDWTSIQVETYFSPLKQQQFSNAAIAEKVCDELTEMGILSEDILSSENDFNYHVRKCDWANVVFTKNTSEQLDLIWDWLEEFGLVRNTEDTKALTNWDLQLSEKNDLNGSIYMAGRFAEWKYYWTDDCVMRGLIVSNALEKYRTPL